MRHIKMAAGGKMQSRRAINHPQHGIILPQRRESCELPV
jgi:hypothetical protein